MPHLRFRFSLRILWVSAASLALLAPFAALKILEPNPVAPVSSPVKTVPLPSSAAQQAVASLRQDATATRLAGLKAGPTSDAAMGARLVESYGKLPLSFEANQGQTDAQVKFLSRGSGYGLFLTGDEAVLALRRASQESRVESREGKLENGKWKLETGKSKFENRNWKLETANLPAFNRQSPIFNRQSLLPTPDSLLPTPDSLLPTPDSLLPIPDPPAPSVLRLKLVGANPKAKVAGLDELPGKSNYFLGNDPKKWRTNVPNYAQVRYKDVYPGIDLVYYGHQGQLEYDWVVAPGADPRVIVLNVEGAEKMEIDAQGDLVLRADGGDIRLHRPLVYQPTSSVYATSNSQFIIHNSELVDGHFVLLAQNRIGFGVGDYDRSRPLIIDPVLSYSTYLGGSGNDEGYGIAVDSAGNAYVTGYTYSTDFPTANPLQPSNAGAYDAFVTKLNASGSALVYSTYLGGSDMDEGYGIAVDSGGNAYVTGYAESANFPTTPGAFQGACAMYTYWCSGDAFVTKLNAAGSALVYSTYLGGRSRDGGDRIAVDSSGNAYVTGWTYSTDFPPVDPLQGACGGCAYGYADAFVSKLNAAGSALVYSTYLGGSSDDVGSGIAVDSAGSAYVTGYTSSTNFPTLGPLQAAHAGGQYDAFVTKLTAAGSALVYSTYLGGSSDDRGYGIAVDSAGNAYVTGYTCSTDFPTANALQTSLAGECSFSPMFGAFFGDAFVAKLNPAGSALVYSTYLGGSSQDWASGIAVDSAGNAYVVGQTNSMDFPLANAIQGKKFELCCYDAFVAKLNAAGDGFAFSTYLGGDHNDIASGIAVDASGNVYVSLYTNSVGFPVTSEAFQDGAGITCPGGGCYKAFVAKISPEDAVGAALGPMALTFSDQAVGTTSAVQLVRLNAAGTQPLSVSSIVASGDFAQTNSCGSSVRGGWYCWIWVTFTPTAPGTRTGTVTVAYDAPGSPRQISLTGTGAGPLVTLSPSSLDLGSQEIGTTSAARTVTLTNTGNATLTITSLAVSGDFAQTTTCLANTSPGGSCTFSVTFTPTALGTRTGSLTITDNATGSPQKVALSGYAVALGASPARLFFPRQAVGTTSRPQAVTLRNALTTPLALTGIKATGDFGQTNDCGGAIPAGGSCTVRVVFAPTVAGTRNGFLTIRDAAESLSGSVLLSGLGVATRKGTGSGRVASH